MKIKMWTKGWSFIFVVTAALAQQAPFTPAPQILQIHREQIVPGREPDYMRVETGAVGTESQLNFPHVYLTLQGINQTGDIWYVNGYDTYADLEQLGAQIAANPDITSALNNISTEKADLVADPHAIFARYRDDLSFGRGLSGQRTRYFAISIISSRPGHVRDYADIRRIIRAAHERASSGEIHSVYQVESGMPDGTFLIFTPAATLEDAGNTRQFDQNTFENDLDTQSRARLRELNDAAVVQSETQIFRINPAISFPAKEWMNADPEFWRQAAR
ncbi:MAG TPA: hypothetical protein VGF16_13785 [Bryobacteraceae bacterium]|jgi:hypothetical protein